MNFAEWIKTKKNIDYKKHLKVGLITSDPYITRKSLDIVNGNDSSEKRVYYTGMLYEIWDKIKLMNNLDVEEIDYGLEYQKSIEDLKLGKIDILIGNIWVFEERANDALFTRPIFLSKIVIAHKPKRNKVELYWKLIKRDFLIPLFVIISIGIILGTILHYVEPERGRVRSVWTAMSSFLGEMGYLFENSRLRPAGMVVGMIIALLGYYYNLFLQASATSNVINETSTSELEIKNLANKRFAMPKTFDIGNILQKYHIDYDSVDVTADKIAEYYLENLDKYDGYLSEYELIKNDMRNHSEIKMSSHIYGYEENTFAISHKHPELLQKMNYSIAKLQKDDTIKHVCEKYLGDNDSNLCVL